jgi:hypothetical protein
MIERVPAAQSSMKMITRNFILSEMERIVVVYVIGGLWCCVVERSEVGAVSRSFGVVVVVKRSERGIRE